MLYMDDFLVFMSLGVTILPKLADLAKVNIESHLKQFEEDIDRFRKANGLYT